MQHEADRLRNLPNKEACLRAAYDTLTAKYRGYRGRTYIHILDLFSHDINRLWRKEGFLHCTNLNVLLAILLLESGHFKVADITFHWTTVYGISPHQFTRVRLSGDKLVDIDLWGKAYGVRFGRHAHGFIFR
jgi:hypothetical protein